MTISPPKDFTPIHEKWTYEIVPREEPKSGEPEWPRTRVLVKENGVGVHVYDRNYSMLSTFEPFRQYNADTDTWHEYALISPQYSTYEVIDLVTFDTIAKRGYPQRAWRDGEYAELFAKHPDRFAAGGYYEGKTASDTTNAEGFCAFEFYVPDIISEWGIKNVTDWNNLANRSWFTETFKHSNGSIGFVSGCMWGDDSSAKLRTIDLSYITNGQLVENESLGYFEVPSGKLKEQITIEDGEAHISMLTRVSLDSMQVQSFPLESVNWAPIDNDPWAKSELIDFDVTGVGLVTYLAKRGHNGIYIELEAALDVLAQFGPAAETSNNYGGRQDIVTTMNPGSLTWWRSHHHGDFPFRTADSPVEMTEIKNEPV